MKNFILTASLLLALCFPANAQKVTDLPANATPATGDVLYTIDVSDTTDDAAGSGKRTTILQMEAILESILDLQDQQGAVTDAQVPDTITINNATTAATATNALALEGVDLGTLTDTRICTYDAANTEIDCTTVAGTSVSAGNIAATVCSSTSSESCDYTADGTDDHLTIQQALDDLPAEGGLVQLTEGDFSIGGTIIVDSFQTVNGFGFGTLLINETNSNAAILAADTESGITISNLRVDGDGTNQSSAFSVIDMENVSYSKFSNLWITGGLRTGTYPTVSSDGEGIVLRNSEYNTLVNIHSYLNAYDGVKLRSSDYNTLTNINCVDNGRACIQISYDLATPSDGSDHNTVSNVGVFHTDGVAHASSPVTSGIYIHTGNLNTVNNINIRGTEQGIGMCCTSVVDNIFTNAVISVRGSTGDMALQIDADSDRNIFSNIYLLPISGASQDIIQVASSSDNNIFSNITYSAGGGTGTWVIDLDGNNNLFLNSRFTSSVTISDSGSGNVFFGNVGLKNDFDFASGDSINFDAGATLTLETGSALIIQDAADVDITGSLTLVGTLIIDNNTPGCIMYNDTDLAGFTECFALNGTQSCTVDADGLCDGS
jgi:parallel beta-helix repeat protein